MNNTKHLHMIECSAAEQDLEVLLDKLNVNWHCAFFLWQRQLTLYCSALRLLLAGW